MILIEEGYGRYSDTVIVAPEASVVEVAEVVPSRTPAV